MFKYSKSAAIFHSNFTPASESKHALALHGTEHDSHGRHRSTSEPRGPRLGCPDRRDYRDGAPGRPARRRDCVGGRTAQKPLEDPVIAPASGRPHRSPRARASSVRVHSHGPTPHCRRFSGSRCQTRILTRYRPQSVPSCDSASPIATRPSPLSTGYRPSAPEANVYGTTAQSPTPPTSPCGPTETRVRHPRGRPRKVCRTRRHPPAAHIPPRYRTGV